MKIRNGFVSNSSSSSFIIALQKPEVCDKCGQTVNDFIKTLLSTGYTDNEVLERNSQEIINSLTKEKEYISNFGHVMDRISKNLTEGKEIVKVQISYHDTETREKLFSGEIEIICSDEDFDFNG